MNYYLKDKKIFNCAGIFSGLMQNEITISKDQLKESIKAFKSQRELAIAEFNESIEEIDELAKDAIKFAHKHMVE